MLFRSVKFASKNEFEKKTQMEAVARTKRNEVESKVLVQGKSNTRTNSVKLSNEDEIAYQIWSGNNPGKDRRYFKKLLNS